MENISSKEDKINESVKRILDYNFAPIARALKEPDVTDIHIDRYDHILFREKGKLKKSIYEFNSEQDLEDALELLSNTLEQDAFGFEHPLLDAKLPDGSRVSAAHKTLCREGTSVTIRLHRPFKYCLNDYVEIGTLSPLMAEYLIDAVKAQKNIVISGSTGSWKSSIINALIAFIDEDKRILIGEDTGEIQVKHKSVIFLEAPQRKSVDNERKNLVPVTLPMLVDHALRRDPDSIIIGEIRSMEAAAAAYRTLISGHKGLMTTLHTNTCEEAIEFIIGYTAGFLKAGDALFHVIKKQMYSSIDIIIHLQQREDGSGMSYINEMVEVTSDGLNHLIGGGK